MKVTILTARVPAQMAGLRLDQALARLFPDYSRARLQQWVRAGHVRVDGQPSRSRDKVRGGEAVALHPQAQEREDWQAQALPLDVVYEDDELIVVNKPPGLVVHPAVGNPDRTLVNALLHHDPRLARVPRAGIIHRLDKHTSGLLVVARSLRSHKRLVDELKRRSVSREYRTLVIGVLTAGGRIEAAIGRDPRHRTRMAVVTSGKPAVSHYRVLERFQAHSYLRVMLETGRTHQIRVHMAHLRHPVLGDPLYGGRLKLPPGATPQLADSLRAFKRQALHAARLQLTHPASGETVSWEAPLPDDMARLLHLLRTAAGVPVPPDG